MKEAHITTDPRTGLFDDQPLRTFTVIRREMPAVEVRAHMVNQLESGALVLITLRGGLAFVSRGFAAGQWIDFNATVPTVEEVKSIKAFAEREQAIMTMLAHDAQSTRM